jgi:hypothetical protein
VACERARTWRPAVSCVLWIRTRAWTMVRRGTAGQACLPSPFCVAAGGPRLAPGCAAPEAFDAACVLDAPIAVAGYMLRWRWPAMQPICSEKTKPASYILVVNLRLV